MKRSASYPCYRFRSVEIGVRILAEDSLYDLAFDQPSCSESTFWNTASSMFGGGRIGGALEGALERALQGKLRPTPSMLVHLEKGESTQWKQY
jgi:hypothetical protein